MRLLTIIFIAIILSGCNIDNDLAIAQNKEIEENESLGSIQIISQGETFWNIDNPQNFGTYSIERTSKYKDEEENFIRPFNKVKVSNIYLKSEPTMGDKVTIIPLEVDLQSFELTVIKSEKTIGESCDRKKKSVFWLTELEIISKQVFFDMKPLKDRGDEYPFDVFILYPSNPKAKNLKKTELRKSTIPNEVTVNTIVAAIDINDDKKPEYIKTEYCCRNNSESYSYENDCFYCKNMYQKLNHEWKTIQISTPCKLFINEITNKKRAFD